MKKVVSNKFDSFKGKITGIRFFTLYFINNFFFGS